VAENSLVESVDACMEIGYKAVQDISLLLLSTIYLHQGELDRAHKTVLDGLALAEHLHDPWAIASGLQTLGEIFLQQEKYFEARMNFERSLQASRIVGDKIITGGALVNLAVLTNLQNQFAESDRYAEEALSIFQLIGDETQQPFPMRIMGYAAAHAGNVVRARVLMRESLVGNTNLLNLREQLACLIGFAQCSLVETDLQQAVRLSALAEKHKRQHAFKFREPDNAMLNAIVQHAKKELGEAAYELIYKEGEAMNLKETLGRFRQ
jgi:tetratricopeptide (TPR) repeat protein